MRSTLNLVIVLALMLFTISCGLLEDDSQDASANTENSESAATGVQDAYEGEESGSQSDSPKEGDGQVEDKSITVRFGKGSTSRSYKDSLSGEAKHEYIFGVSEDQRISVKIASNDGMATLRIYDPVGKRINLSSGGDKDFSETVPESGNYKIEVVTRGDRSDYTVTFSASALPVAEDDEPQNGGVTKTVRFAKGRSSASYRGAVIRGDRDFYNLGAKGGQTMSVSISSLEDNAVFQIRGPGGYLRGAEPGSDASSWNGQLPVDGNYRVIVGGTRGNATYTITFSIR